MFDPRGNLRFRYVAGGYLVIIALLIAALVIGR